jgi:class 3 adenylate cyclase
MSCPTCRAEPPESARFCPACGARLEASGTEATERKVVTTLFADLVGFTALGERHDPEDIDAALRGFYGLARTIVERFGGTVEKFIGDAVVGLFGVPAAHEDDAERAVRAALELVAHLHELPPIGGEDLQVRCAVNTGPALVRLHARPEAGEGVLVGDAVNTCARLLAGTPSMTVAAGVETRRLTAHAVAYEALPPLTAKGKARPLARWRALSAVARYGSGPGPRDDRPMVGREIELAVLAGLLDRSAASRAPQYVLIAGEAGVGKSRLVRELFRLVDERPGVLCNWRQSSCPAYGAGLASRAIREIVCAHAGILPGDDADVAERKLRQAAEGEPDEWLVARMLPLVGLAGPQYERHERFAAWARFLEDIAIRRPAVVVIEDLHWADDLTLEFLRYFAEHATGVPLLLVCTARPEFLDTHADALDLTQWTRLDVRALDPSESSRIAGGLLAERDDPELAALVAERCGGNPLFAEELAHFYLEETPAGEDVSEKRQETPTSLLALIAARLDALPAEQKSLLVDASIFGLSFSPEGVAATAARGARDVISELAKLERREFVRRDQDASGDVRFRFWHALVRDVAYDELSRRSRALRHLRAASWLAERAMTSDDDVEAAAHHFAAGLELARASGDATTADGHRDAAHGIFVMAGDRALQLDVGAAGLHYERALATMDEDDPSRPALLLKLGTALRWVDRDEEAAARQQAAAELYAAAGDRRGQAQALSQVAFTIGEEYPAEGHAWLERAVRLLDDDASVEAISVLETQATLLLWEDDLQGVQTATRRILAMQQELGQPQSPRALGLHGYARCMLGEPEGLQEQEAAIAAAEARSVAPVLFGIRNAYARWVCIQQDPGRALALTRRWRAEAARRRDLSSAIEFDMYACRQLLLCGLWDEALASADEVARENRDAFAAVSETEILAARIGAHLGRGTPREALRDAERYLHATEHLEPPSTFAAIGVAALFRETGREEQAVRLLESLLTTTRFVLEPLDILLWPLAVATALGVDRSGLATQLARLALDWPACPLRVRLSLEAQLAEARGAAREAARAYEEAASAWALGGAPHEEGLALFGYGRCLRATGREADALSALSRARAVLAGNGARSALQQVDQLLQTEQSEAAAARSADSRLASPGGTAPGGRR